MIKSDDNRIWGKIAELDKIIAVTCHEIQDLKDNDKEIRDKIMYVKSTVDGLTKQLITDNVLKNENVKDRNNRVIVAIIGSLAGAIAILVGILVSHIK